jgi:hypothetical protein
MVSASDFFWSVVAHGIGRVFEMLETTPGQVKGLRGRARRDNVYSARGYAAGAFNDGVIFWL